MVLILSERCGLIPGAASTFDLASVKLAMCRQSTSVGRKTADEEVMKRTRWKRPKRPSLHHGIRIELQKCSRIQKLKTMRKNTYLWFGFSAALVLLTVSLYFAITTPKPPLGLLLCPFLAVLIGFVILQKIKPV
jgi:hypothetical protein